MNATTYILWIATLVVVGITTYALGVEWQVTQDMIDLRNAGY
jgi:hypothetical protein